NVFQCLKASLPNNVVNTAFFWLLFNPCVLSSNSATIPDKLFIFPLPSSKFKFNFFINLAASPVGLFSRFIDVPNAAPALLPLIPLSAKAITAAVVSSNDQPIASAFEETSNADAIGWSFEETTAAVM